VRAKEATARIKINVAELADQPHFAEIEALYAEVFTWVESVEALAV